MGLLDHVVRDSDDFIDESEWDSWPIEAIWDLMLTLVGADNVLEMADTMKTPAGSSGRGLSGRQSSMLQCSVVIYTFFGVFFFNLMGVRLLCQQ